MQHIYFVANLLAVTLFTATLLPVNVLSKEPKSFKDLWDHWGVYSHCEEPFIYRIQNTPDIICGAKCLSDIGTIKVIFERNPDGSLRAPNAHSGFLLDCGKTSFGVNIRTFSSLVKVKETFIGLMALYPVNYHYWTPTMANAFLGYDTSPNVPRSFFNVQFEKNLIGNISFDRRFGNFEEHSVYQVVFARGNTVVNVDFPYPKYFDRKMILPERQVPVDYQLGWSRHMVPILCDVKHIFDIDPRKIAYHYDRYLTDCPLKKSQNEAKQKLKTLELTLPKDAEFEQGKEYPLDFPRKSSDGTVPAEIRLVVSRGEIQQVIETNAAEGVKTSPDPASLANALLPSVSFAPDIDGKYTVLFGQPEKQSIRCYHIDEEGKCLAWGEIEVLVKKSPKK